MDFYVLDHNLFLEGEFAYSEHFSPDFTVGEPERCPVCKGAVSMLEVLPPIEVTLTKGLQGDFVSGEISPCIVSEKFQAAYLKSDLKGIEKFVPVEVKKIKGQKKGTPIDVNYAIPYVQRGTARIDEAKSNFIRTGKLECTECKKGTIIQSYDKLILNPDTWSGEDIFTARWLSGKVFLSRKFVDFVIENKFTNHRFTPAAQYRSRF